MIEIRQIYTSDEDLYSFVEGLLIISFPEEQRRELSLQREYTNHHIAFRNNVILDKNKPIGLISYWNFGSFVFIEHFAIDASVRNAGYGQQALNLLTNRMNVPVILEVELPVDSISKKRIAFYGQQGFALWKTEYYQPPYSPNGNYIPMNLMVKGNLSEKEDFDIIKSRLYKNVYSI